MHKRKSLKKTTKLLAAFVISLPVLLAGITTHPQSASAAGFEAQGEEDGLIPENCLLPHQVDEQGLGLPYCPTGPEPDPEPEQCIDFEGDHPITIPCPEEEVDPVDPHLPIPVYTGETCYEQVGNPLEVILYRPVLCVEQPDDTPDNPVDLGSDDTPVAPTPELDSTQLTYDDLVVHTFSYLSTRASLFGYSNCPNGGISYGDECGSGSIFNSSVPGDVAGSVAANICRQANTRAQAGKADPDYGMLIDFEGYEGGEDGLVARVEGTELSRFSAEGLWVLGYNGGSIPVNTDGDRVTPVVSGLGDCARTSQDTLVKSASPGSTPSVGLDNLAFNILAEKDAAVAAGNDPPANAIALVRVRTYCPTNVAFVGVDVLKFGKMVEYLNLRNHERFDEISEALEHDTFRVCVFDRVLLGNHLRGLGKSDADVAADLQSFDDLVYGRPTYVYVAPNPPPAVEPVDACETDPLADCPPHLIVKVPEFITLSGGDYGSSTIQSPIYQIRYVDGDNPAMPRINSPFTFDFDTDLFAGHPDPDYEYFDNEGPGGLYTMAGINAIYNSHLLFRIFAGDMSALLDVHARIDTQNALAREWHHIKYSLPDETQDRIDMGEFTISFDPPETIITVCNRYLYPDCWAQLPDEPPLPPTIITTPPTTLPPTERDSDHTTRDEVSINVAESVRTGAATRVEFLANDQCRVAARSADRCTGSRPTIVTQPSEGTASIVAGGLGGWQLEYRPFAWASDQDIVEYIAEVDGSDYSKLFL